MLGAPLVFQPWSVDVQPSMEPEWCQWLEDTKSKPAISLLQLAERKTPSSDLSDRPKFQQVDSLYIDYIDPKIDPHSAAQPLFAPRCFCLAKDLDNGIKVSRCGVAFLRINSDGHSRGLSWHEAARLPRISLSSSWSISNISWNKMFFLTGSGVSTGNATIANNFQNNNSTKSTEIHNTNYHQHQLHLGDDSITNRSLG